MNIINKHASPARSKDATPMISKSGVKTSYLYKVFQHQTAFYPDVSPDNKLSFVRQ